MSSILQRWKQRRNTEKQARQDERDMAEFQRKLYSPHLFNPKQRQYLASLFPDGWCHFDNIPQPEVFKIALTMTLFGYECNSVQTMKFCLHLLKCQKIYLADKTNPLVIKQIVQPT